MSNSSEQTSPYIFRPSNMMQQPPFAQKNALLYGFFVKGETGKLQAMLDRDLNAVSQGKYYFKPLSEYVMLTFTDIPKDYSLSPQDRQKGWGAEKDVSIWVPVGSFVDKNGEQHLDQVFWYTPYIWVDNSITVSVGREVYGFPKNLGRFEFPPESAPNHFRTTVNGFSSYSPETEAGWQDLLTVDNLRPGSSPVNKWDDFIETLKGLWDVATSLDIVKPDWHFAAELIHELLQPQLPQLFLKQFPDGSGERVSYQALCSSPARIEQFHGAGILDGEFQLTINDVASFPLAEDLGLSLGAQTAAFGFWIKMDFVLEQLEQLFNNTQMKREKIAILGGGVSSVTAAFALTSEPDWQHKYDITFYQLGWRIGGKGASGRNAALGQRIEEHGLHIWFGFYENAFKYMQQCYDELNRPEGAPLRTWEDAFKKHSFIVAMEHIKDEWLPWSLLFPEKPGDPGKGTESLSWWKLITTMFAFLKQWLGQLHNEIEQAGNKNLHGAVHESLIEHVDALAKRVGGDIKEGINDAEYAAHGLLKLVESFPEEVSQHSHDDYNWIKKILEAIKAWIDKTAAEFLDDHTIIRRLFIMLDMGITILVGMIEDEVFFKGFNNINDIDFQQWLAKHHANQQFTVDSAPVRALYDLVFGYLDGDIRQANLEAGTGLRGLLLIGLAYKGAVMWKMQAGMGDTIFTPYYQVLKNRGVQFKFFHEVNQLHLDPNDQSIVQSFDVTRQVDLCNGPASYEPLVPVKGLPCWPSKPRYEQIVPAQAKLLQAHNIDLENFWTDWPEVYQQAFAKPLPQETLVRGRDFDTIIYGIPVSCLPFNCEELLAQSSTLSNCHTQVKAVVTQAYQLWTGPALADLGWTLFPDGEDPVLGAWTEPVDTWAAMNQLLCREDWQPLGLDPKNIAYYCGVQPVVDIPPRSDHAFPHKATEAVKQASIAQLNNDMWTLWPKAGRPGEFDWSVLIDPENRRGEARFDAQYWRSNTSPTERYTLSVVNSTQHRIPTKLPEFSNIYFTGDWIFTGLNAGCVEAATMAGLQTSRAICGFPKLIYGEKDFV